MRKAIVLLLTAGIVAISFLWMEERFQISQYVFADEERKENSRDRLIKEVREGMLNREKNIAVKLMEKPEKVEASALEIVEEAFRIDEEDNSDDFDYLKYHYSGVTAQIRGYGNVFRIEYLFEYLDNKQEITAVNEIVDKVLKLLDIEKKEDFEKIKSIHDYIVQNTAYDLNIKYNSAYGALVHKISACQGYAVLTYKMMTKAGIPCRIIAGKAKEEPHAWNIVKLDGLWYNLDCTWDDPVGALDKDYISYDYFLKCNDDFLDHRRDAEYETEQFDLEYVMSGYSR